MVTLTSASFAIPEGFHRPQFGGKVDVEGTLAALTTRQTAKGLYFRAMLQEAESFGQFFEGYGPYRDFKDYPVAEACNLLVDVGRRLYPDETLARALRRLGWVIFPTLLSTMAGKVVFGALGNDMTAVVANAHKGFEISIADGHCEVLRAEEGIGHLRVTDFHLFPDCFLVGVFEGAFAYYDIEVETHVKQIGAYSWEYLTLW